MAIIRTITNEYEFWDWVAKSDGYKNNFSLEGAKALQAHYEDYSEQLGEDVEFDPIAWCCGWSEYSSISEAYSEHYGDGSEIMICEALPKAKADALVALIQDRERQARIDENDYHLSNLSHGEARSYSVQKIRERQALLKGGK